MAIKQPDGTFNCGVCGMNYGIAAKADQCRDNHNLVYLPLTKDELNRLLMAMKLGDMSLVSESVFTRMEALNRKTLTRE